MEEARGQWRAFIGRYGAITLSLWLGVYLMGLVLCFVTESPVRVFLKPFYTSFLLIAAMTHLVGCLSLAWLVSYVRPGYRTAEKLGHAALLIIVFILHYTIVRTTIVGHVLNGTHPIEWPRLLLVGATVFSAVAVFCSRSRKVTVAKRIAWTIGVVPFAGLLIFIPGSLNFTALLVLIAALLYLLPALLSYIANKIRSYSLQVALLSCIPLACFAAATLHTMRAESPWRFGTPCERPHQDTRPNILIVVLDTVKASHLATYGYSRDTMPRLHEWAKRPEVLVFTRAYAEANWTLPSHGSLFTGLYPSRHAAYSRLKEETPWALPLDPRHVTLSDRLRASGYMTSAVVGPERISFSGAALSQGFHYCDARGPLRTYKPFVHLLADYTQGLFGLDLSRHIYSGLEHSRRAPALTDDLLRELEDLDGCPFFLFGNYLDAHAPYDAPEPYRHRWEGRSPRFVDGGMGLPLELARAIERGEAEVTDEVKRHIASLYDGELSYLDAHLGRLLDYLDSNKRLYDNTLVVITSNHGEGLGEHNVLGHRRTLYNDQIHIPLLVKLPSRYPVSGEIDKNRLVQLVDIFATALHVVGIELPKDTDGIPLHGTRKAAFSEHVTVSAGELLFETTILEGKLKYYLTPRDELLFDLDEDPKELNNLADARTEEVDQFREIYRIHRERAQPLFEDTPTRSLSEEELLKLRALGYVQ